MKETSNGYTIVKRLVGKGLSPGISFGIAHRVESEVPAFYRISIRLEDVEAELIRLQEALGRSRQQYLGDKERLEKALGKEHSYIIDAHLQMLQDPQFLSEIEERIQGLDSPEKALRCVSEELLAAYQSLEDPFFRERSFDFEEVVDRIISNLLEIPHSDDPELPDDLILVAPQIGMSTLVKYPLERVKGLVLGKAGQTSHVAIVARSHQIPVVSGIRRVKENIRTGQALVVDGSEGSVEIVISSEQIEKVRNRVDRAKKKLPEVIGDLRPCRTRDEVSIHVYGNAEVASEVKLALELGAEGIGLFRSEFIYLQGGGSLDTKHHFTAYQALAETVGERPALVRTLDVGIVQDQLVSVQTGEENAVLGLRGIRFSLKHPEIFKEQVRSILRARETGNLQIVLPMVSSVDELLESRRLIHEVQAELGGERAGKALPIGVLVEVPAAILILPSIARHVDFLAVGTNDLIQYTLAAGRLSEEVADLYNPLHPAVLRSLEMVEKVAREHGLMTFVCGEMASHPVQAAILVGMGFRHLSMTPFAIPRVKRMLRQLTLEELSKRVDELLTIETLSEIEYFVERQFGTQIEMEPSVAERLNQR